MNGLKQIRVRHMLTADKAAKLLGVSVRTYRHWEKGDCKPTATSVNKIFKRLYLRKVKKYFIAFFLLTVLLFYAIL